MAGLLVIFTARPVASQSGETERIEKKEVDTDK
jgi:hypothetical protein